MTHGHHPPNTQLVTWILMDSRHVKFGPNHQRAAAEIEILQTRRSFLNLYFSSSGESVPIPSVLSDSSEIKSGLLLI